MPKITISDIARKAEVSKTTVSFAFNDPTRLPEETVKRILSIADQLGYSPNPVARSMTTKRTGTVRNDAVANQPAAAAPGKTW